MKTLLGVGCLIAAMDLIGPDQRGRLYSRRMLCACGCVSVVAVFTLFNLPYYADSVEAAALGAVGGVVCLLWLYVEHLITTGQTQIEALKREAYALDT
jgi:hypothetical protein